VAIRRAETLQNAVDLAAQAAHAGDTVLLAPACASFDQFQNYEHRGRAFKELVHQLQRRAELAAKEISKLSGNTEKRNAETFGK
jgi:hypothetical protein